DLPPEEEREAVFIAAARKRQALLEQIVATFSRHEILEAVAEEMKTEPAKLDSSMFADLKSEQSLTQFCDTTSYRLLTLYNVALAQSILLRSTGVDIVIRGETPARYRQLFRQVKFRRLICDVDRVNANAYRLHLDGPLSLFSATQKYGLQLTLLLPTLLLCSDFDLKAKLRWGTERKAKVFQLSSRDGLVSHQAETGAYVPPEVPMFVEMFQKKVV